MKYSSSSLRLRLIAVGTILLTGLFLVSAYTLLHEGGHALTGVLFGGRVTGFNTSFWDLSAHVGLAGDAGFSRAQNAVVSVAGVGLPILVWTVTLLLLPQVGNLALTWLKLLGSANAYGPLLVWVVFPCLYARGITPADDSIHFLEITRITPWLISLSALSFLCATAAVTAWRCGGMRRLLETLRSPLTELDAPSTRKTMWMVVIGAIMVSGISWGLSAILPDSQDLAVPDGYTQIARIDLRERGYQHEPALTLNLETPTRLGLFILLVDVKGPVEIVLTSPGGAKSLLLSGDKDFSAGRATIDPGWLDLAAGKHYVLLTAPQAKGRIEIYRR